MVCLEERDRYWLLLSPQQRLCPSGHAKRQARLLGRNPATQKSTRIREFGQTRSNSFTDQRFSTGKSQDTFPITFLLLKGQNHTFCMIPICCTGKNSIRGKPLYYNRVSMTEYVVLTEFFAQQTLPCLSRVCIHPTVRKR